MAEAQNKVTEIELAYLINQIPEQIKEANPVVYTDTYLSSEDDLLVKMRLRQKGDKYELTKKVVLDPTDLSVQKEYNLPLTAEEYRQFKTLGGRVVSKDRYNVEIAGYMAEVDVFKGPLQGFVMVEFEFSSTTERDAFMPPAICTVEVTQEDFIAGAYLAGKSYTDIQSELERFGYKPLFIR